MKFNRLVFLSTLLVLSSFAHAIDVRINRCSSKFISALNRLEVKGASELDIIQINIDKPIDYIFGEHKLTMAPLASKFDEKKAIYRYPGIASKVLDRFETVKLIKNMPDTDIAKLLEPNVIYTYTIQDQRLSIAKSKPGRIRDYASKHMLLSADETAGELRMGGEMWVDNKGVLHYDQGSGTYKPGAEDLKRAERFFRDHLGIKNSEAHYFQAPAVAVETATTAQEMTGVNQQIKAIKTIQTTILQKRRVIAGYKFFLSTQFKKDELQKKLQSNQIQLTNNKGEIVQYKLKKIEDFVTEEIKFDTSDKKLEKNGYSFHAKTITPGEDLNDLPISGYKESSAAKALKKLGYDFSQMKKDVIKRTDSVKYALYEMLPNGKVSKKPSMLVGLDSVGQIWNDHSASIETPDGQALDVSLAKSLRTKLNLD